MNDTADRNIEEHLISTDIAGVVEGCRHRPFPSGPKPVDTRCYTTAVTRETKDVFMARRVSLFVLLCHQRP